MRTDNHPFTGVYRGRVVAIADRQHVHGGGAVLGGWGGMRVDTETRYEFWIRRSSAICFSTWARRNRPR